jgi:hypothetical protein
MGNVGTHPLPPDGTDLDATATLLIHARQKLCFSSSVRCVILAARHNN